MVNKDKCNLPVNKFFEYATEDIGTYLLATKSWTNPPEGCRLGYLLILILSNRFRSRRALEIMDSIALPESYVTHKTGLTTLWLEAEKILKEEILADTTKCLNVISDEFLNRLNNLEKTLERVKDIAEDGILMDDYEWTDEEEDIAEDFILHFQDMYLTKEELKITPLKETKVFRNFEEKFNNIEQRFKQYFGYFHAIGDFILNTKSRDYNIDTWWLRKPEFEEVEEDDLVERIFEKYKKILSLPKITDEPCPDAELVIAYALGEFIDEYNKIEEHLSKCRLCLNLFIDVRAVEPDVRTAEEKVRDMYNEIKGTTGTITISGDDLNAVSAGPPILTTKVLAEQRMLQAYSRQLGEEGEEKLENLENPIELSLKTDENENYILLPEPDSNLITSCSTPESYKKLYEFIRDKAIVYGAGCVRKEDREIEVFEPQVIKKLNELIKFDKTTAHKFVTIGLSGDKDMLGQGIKALKENDQKKIAELNIIWLKCSLK